MDLQKLAAAKLWLVSPAPPHPQSDDGPRDLPYLSQALYALIPVACPDVARISCDEWWRIYVNEAWLTEATVPEVGAELAHATWHLLADHTNRARDQDVDQSTARPWATATDITISATLQPDDLVPDGLATAAEHRFTSGRSAEEYFAQLARLRVDTTPGRGQDPVDSQVGCGSGADGLPRQHEYGPDVDIGAVSSFEGTEIRRRVAIEYREHAQRRGSGAGDAERWVKQVLTPQIAWEPLLSGAVRRAVGWAAGRGDFTYSRPSRRTASLPGVILPGQHRPRPRVSVLIDTSGSVDDALLARALGEVDGALLALGAADGQLTVYSVDAAVHTAQKVRRARDAKLVGAGGTDLRVGFMQIEAERPRPDVVIVFTDGDTPWPASPPPGSVVIAAVLGRYRTRLPPTPAWAVRVECVDSP